MKSDVSKCDNLQEIKICKTDTIFTYDSDYPIGVKLYGSHLYVIKAKNNQSIDVIDLTTNQKIWETGTIGYGPEDVISPDFISFSDTTDRSEYRMIDVNDQSLILINPIERHIHKEKLPKFIGFSSNVAFFDDYTIGVKNNDECMFFIHSNKEKEPVYVENDLILDDAIIDKIGSMSNYMRSVNILSDYTNKRIIAAHYFFDIFSIYDFCGNLLKSSTLSGDSYSVNEEIPRMMYDNAYIGYTNGCSDGKAFYLQRLTHPSSESEPIVRQIIKIDPEGTPTAIIDTDGAIHGQFDIDNDNIYAVVKDVSDNNEYYHIVRWKLCQDLNKN